MGSYDIFICYESTTGKSYAENLKKALDRDNHNAFLADITLKSGDVWGEERDLALRKCRFFVIVITALTLKSPEVIKEYKDAIRGGKRVIPCKYSDISRSETMELANLQQLNFRTDSELANKVIIEIRKIVKDEEEGIKIENDPKELLRRGILLFNLKLFDEALRVYDKAIEIKSDFAEAWNNKGNVLNSLGLPDEALDAFDKAIEIKSDAVAWSNKGGTLNNLGRFYEALKSFDKAIELKPDFAEAWYNKGFVLDNLSRYKEAVESYDKAIELKPDFALAWNNKGNVLNKLGYPDEALRAYDKAIELKPDYVYALCSKGATLDGLGNPYEALKLYNKAIEIKPDFAGAWYNKGVALGHLGRNDEAIRAYDKTIELERDFSEALYNRASIIYFLKGDKENALRDLSKAIELDAKNKENAKKNKNFKNLWDDEDFKRLVG